MTGLLLQCSEVKENRSWRPVAAGVSITNLRRGTAPLNRPVAPDHHGFSDPIVIPLTLTIPGPSRPPSAGLPDSGLAGLMRKQPFTLAQLVGPIPVPPMVLPGPAPDPSWPAFDRAWARARRRAGQAAGEIRQGDYGAAAGHLLGGRPFPAGVDDPLGTILNTDRADLPRRDPTEEEAETEALAAEAERLRQELLAGELDERHLQAAESDRRNEPVRRPDGSPYDHVQDVAQGMQRLEKMIGRLKKKLEHVEDVQPGRPSRESYHKAQDTLEALQQLRRTVFRRIPRIRVRRN